MKMRIGPRASGFLHCCTVALSLQFAVACPALAAASPLLSATRHAHSADEYVPVVLIRDMPLLERALQLDEGQRSILMALSTELSASAPSRESSIAFLESLRAILTDEQMALIPDALRELRRERMQTAAGIGGERVDVGMVAERHLRGITSEATTQIIQRYWRELDLLLAARDSAEPLTSANADRDSSRVRRSEQPSADRETRGAATSGTSEVLRTRVLIRELNDNAIAELTAAMPEALAKDFELNALAEGYPNAFVPSGTLEQLKAIAAEHPSPALVSLRDEAARKLDELRTAAVKAIRKRDAAPLYGGTAQEDADQQIAKCERAYADFENWLLAQITETESPEQLAKTASGRALLDRAKVAELSSGHNWDDQQATVSRFDRNGDGELSGEESSQILDAFVRTVGKRSRWRL